jgi:hypothetical protein
MKTTLRLMGRILRTAGLKAASSSLLELYETRIRQAAAEPTVLGFIDRLSALMQSEPLPHEEMPALAAEDRAAGPSIVDWVRGNVRVASALARLSYKNPDEFEKALAEIPLVEMGGDVMAEAAAWEIPVTITTLTPLTHGGDEKAGNATMFRRITVLGRNGRPMLIPCYAGNALRGQMRDLLADEFLNGIGLMPSYSEPPVALWFFHTLYSGGSLTTERNAPKKARKAAGANEQSESIDYRADFRKRIPPLSLLGMAVGNIIMDGKCDVGDALPDCSETGRGETSFNDLLSWDFLTRRDDLDTPHDENTSMIANWEVLIAGVTLRGGVDLRPNVTSLERSCLASALEMLAANGKLGGSSRRGWGKCRLEYEWAEMPDEYRSWLATNAAETREYLTVIGALA